MSGTRGDYRSYLLRLYRVREAGESHWRASLHSPQGGKPIHFASLSEMIAFLEQEGDLGERMGQSEETAARGEGDLAD